MRTLPIRRVSGIGKVTERLLHSLNISVCGELFEQRHVLYQLFSQTSASFFVRVALGLSSQSSQNNVKRPRKSVSKERTFKEINTADVILAKCKDLSVSLEKDLQSRSLKGKTLTVKLKSVDFAVCSRSITLPKFFNSAEEIYENAKKILLREMKTRKLRLRLMGLRMSHFHDETNSSTNPSSPPNRNSILKFFTPSPNKQPQPSLDSTVHATKQEQGKISTYFVKLDKT